MDKLQAKVLSTQLSAAFPALNNEVSRLVYERYLVVEDWEEAQPAVDYLIANQTWPPTIADIRKVIRGRQEWKRTLARTKALGEGQPTEDERAEVQRLFEEYWERRRHEQADQDAAAET